MLRHALSPAALPMPTAATAAVVARNFWSSIAGSRLAGSQQLATPPWRQACQQQRRRTSAPAASNSRVGSSSSSGSSAGNLQEQPAGEAAAPPPKPRQAFKFCRMCGGPLELVVPDRDSLWRHQCTACGYIDYVNPRTVVGAIVQHEGKILLCRRGIEPQKGLWTVPAGFLECGESTAAGAARETWEEAGARIHIDAPYCSYDIPGISQVYVLFRARLAAPYTFSAQAPESLEAALFAPEDIPFEQLAFSSVSIALRSYIADRAGGTFTVHHGVIVKRPGSGPNEPGSFTLEDHFALPTTLPSR